MTKHRSRRLRKKLHVDEFQEFGFAITLQFKQTKGRTADSLLDEWLEFVESRSWHFGGVSTTKEISGFIVSRDRGSLGEQDREAVVSWAKPIEWLENISVGALEDAWH